MNKGRLKTTVFLILSLLVITCLIVQLQSTPLTSLANHYDQGKVIAISKLLIPVDVVNGKKIRLGRNHDGGYVLIDEGNFDKLYSYGIGDDISFETAFVNRSPVDAYL